MLLRAQENRGFPALRKQLQLIGNDVDESVRRTSLKRVVNILTLFPQNLNPQSLAYHYSGYAPLSIKLIEALTKHGFATFDEVTEQVGSKTVRCDLSPYSAH